MTDVADYEKRVIELEEQVADDPGNVVLRRELHLARVSAGWHEFRIDSVSGVDPQVVIPWVTTRELTVTEEWHGSGAPDQDWLRPTTQVLDGGLTRKIKNHRICDDKKWRRDVVQEYCVAAIEDLAHLCSVVTRMEDLILFKADETGLQKLTIFDRSE